MLSKPYAASPLSSHPVTDRYRLRCFSPKILPRGHLVTSDERNQLERAWISLQTTPQHAPEYNSLFWSFEQTYDLVREDPVEAWNLILTIWSLDRSEPT